MINDYHQHNGTSLTTESYTLLQLFLHHGTKYQYSSLLAIEEDRMTICLLQMIL